MIYVRPWLCAGLVCFAATAALAAPETIRCTILADDFEPREGRLTRVDDRGVQYIDLAGGSQTLPFDRLVRLDNFPVADPKSKPPGKPAPAFVIVFRDGQRWTGAPGKLEGDDLEWDTNGVVGGSLPPTGLQRVPLKSVVAIASFNKANAVEIDRAASSSTTQDELRLTNGDVVAGVLAASDGKTVTSQSAEGQPIAVDWANVRLVKFASIANANDTASAPAAPFRLSLRDGRIIDGHKIASENDTLTFSTASHGDAMKFANGDDILAIEHRGGRARMLATVVPAASSQAPYFPSDSSGGAAGFEVRPTSIVISDISFRCSILAKPRSIVRWTLDGSSKSFVTRYGIPASRPLADATVRIRLDDKVVHEKTRVKSGDVSSLVRLPLGNAKSITLEVDYGDAYDVQDDLYWLDPALLAE